MGLLKKLFGTTSEKEVRAIRPIVDRIEALEEEYSALTDQQLQAKTPEFKRRLEQGESLDDLLPEAFALWKGKIPALAAVVGVIAGMAITAGGA